MTTKVKYTPLCDCGYKYCNGTTVLTGVRFSCCQGQYTYEFHESDFPVYAAAPDLLAAAEVALYTLNHEDSSVGAMEGSLETVKQLRDAIAKAKGGAC